MTDATNPDRFLARQQALARHSLVRATHRIGEAVETVVDVPGWVRRRPVLTLGAGAVAGVMAGTAIRSGSRRLTRGAFRVLVVPLVRPTIRALGASLAGVLVGVPHASRNEPHQD